MKCVRQAVAGGKAPHYPLSQRRLDGVAWGVMRVRAAKARCCRRLRGGGALPVSSLPVSWLRVSSSDVFSSGVWSSLAGALPAMFFARRTGVSPGSVHSWVSMRSSTIRARAAQLISVTVCCDVASKAAISCAARWRWRRRCRSGSGMWDGVRGWVMPTPYASPEQRGIKGRG